MQKNILIMAHIGAAQQIKFLGEELRHLAEAITETAPVVKTTDHKTLTLQDGNFTAGTLEYWVEKRNGENFFHANCFAGTRDKARNATQAVTADFTCSIGLASGDLLDWCSEKMIYRGGDNFDIQTASDGWLSSPE